MSTRIGSSIASLPIFTNTEVLQSAQRMLMSSNHSIATERDPLLPGKSCNEVSAEVEEVEAAQAARLAAEVAERSTDGHEDASKSVLPRSTRIGILVGLWLATFLSVSDLHIDHDLRRLILVFCSLQTVGVPFLICLLCG